MPLPRRPLGGIRVVDFSRVLAGPYCTMVLSDLGADVIKVERPGVGDETRTWGPPFAGTEAAYYLSVNRGKRSIALDLADPDNRRVLDRLIETADVVIENFRSGGAQKLGLGYEDVRRLRPDVVYCSITGFGSAREPADRAGYDFVAQAESGLMSITGDPDGPPMKVGVAVVDVLTGLNAAVGILAALRERDVTGEGRRVEVSLLDSALASLVNVGQAALITDADPRRYGNAHPSIVPYEPFEARDGWLAVAAPNDALWRSLCQAMDRSDLAGETRFATNPDRVRNRDALKTELTLTFAQRSVEEWLARLHDQGVPSGKVRGVREAFETAAAAGDLATIEVEHPVIGRLVLTRSPIRTGEPTDTTPPPLLGEHTDEILRELGCDS